MSSAICSSLPSCSLLVVDFPPAAELPTAVIEEEPNSTGKLENVTYDQSNADTFSTINSLSAEILIHQPEDEGDRKEEEGTSSSSSLSSEEEDSEVDVDGVEDQDSTKLNSPSNNNSTALNSNSNSNSNSSLAPSSFDSSSVDSSDLVEFEIVIDGEVVGSTFLPKRADGDDYAQQALQAKASALKQQRKRKFEERLGYDELNETASGLAVDNGICASCNKEPTKYKCPKCDTGSCSLACVTSHKTRLNCNGVRSRSAYVPLSRMDDRTLANDVAFLTEVERMAGATKRDPSMKDKKGEVIRATLGNSHKVTDEPSGASLFSCTPKHLSSASYTLMAACTQYRNIKLMCMPIGMKLHTDNTSRVFSLLPPTLPSSQRVSLTSRDSVIKWVVHLHFKHRAITAEGQNSDLKIIKRRVDERATWEQLLDAILKPPTHSSITDADSKPSSISPSDTTITNISTALLRHQLGAFIETPKKVDTNSQQANSLSSPSNMPTEVASSPYSHLRLLYSVPFQPANAPRYYSLPICSSILSSLAHKVLIEHPVLLVVHIDDSARYEVEPEPKAPTYSHKSQSKEAKARQPRKKRKGEQTKDERENGYDNHQPMPGDEARKALADSFHPTANPSSLSTPTSSPATQSTSTFTPSADHSPTHPLRSHSTADGMPGMRGGRGGRGGRGRNPHNLHSRGGRGGGRHHNPTPQFAFGVQSEPSQPPVVDSKPPIVTPSLFKKWT